MLGEESTRIRWLSERAALRCEDQAAMQRPGKNRPTGWRPARRRNRARSSGSGGYLGQKWASPDPVNGILCRRCDLALAIKFWLAHVVKKFMNFATFFINLRALRQREPEEISQIVLITVRGSVNNDSLNKPISLKQTLN